MPGYLTKQESIAVAGVADLQIRSLLDHQLYGDPLGEAERAGICSAAWPMFGLLWPSGAHLAARMAQRPLSAGERNLEIGCGLGLASLVGHRRSADTAASDRHPLASAFLAESLRLNGLPAMNYGVGDWAAKAARAGLHVQGQFGLIRFSDVLYDRDARQALAAFAATTSMRSPKSGSSTPTAATAPSSVLACTRWAMFWPISKSSRPPPSAKPRTADGCCSTAALARPVQRRF